MSWIDDLNNEALMQVQNGANHVFMPPQNTPQPKKGGRGGILSSLISEGGAVGGGALGASIGTGILPGIGTLLGGALGAGIGAFGGRVAENEVRDGRLGLGDAAKEAALSAVLGAGPIRLAKGGVTAAKAVKGGASLADALIQAGDKAVGMNAAKTVGEKLSESGEGLIAKEFRLNPTQQANFKKLHGEEAVSVLRRYGIQKPEDIASKIEPLQNAFDSAVKNIPDISRGEAEKALRSIYQPLLDSPVLVRKELGEKLKAQADEILGRFPNRQFVASSGGQVVGEIGAEQATKRLNQLEKLIKQSQTKGGVSGEDLRAAVREKAALETAIKNGVTRTADSVPASALNELRKAFDDAVNYTQRGTNEYTVNKKSADAIRKLLQNTADSAGLKFEGKTFKDVGLELRKLRNLDEVVGKQAYLGTGSLPASLPNLLGATGGGAAAGGPAGAALGLLGTALVNSGPGRRAMANTTLRAGEKLTAKASGANPYGAVALAGRIAPAGLAGSMLRGDQSSGLRNAQQNQTMMTNSTNQPSAANISELSQGINNLSTDSNSPFAPQNLESAIQKIISNGGTLDDAAKFVNLAGTMQKLTSPQGGSKLNSTQLQQANNAQSGLDALATIQQTLARNPNAAKLASLPGGSLTQSLTGTGSYSAALANATDVIGRLRSGGAINADEEKRFRSLLPASFDSPDTISYKINALSSLFERFVNPQSASADTNDLASALLAAQGR